MIETSSGGKYKEPEPSFVQPISDVDKDFVNVVIDKIVSVSNMHFIYLKSTDAHVKMNLGTIVYKGELKPGVEKGAVARYSLGGDRVDFCGWALVRDKSYNWVFQENFFRPIVQEVKPQPVVIQQPKEKKTKDKPKEPVIKQEELYEIFEFYLEAFTMLYLKDYEKVPQYKKAGNLNGVQEKSRELRKLLFVVQSIIEKNQNKSHLEQVVIRSALIDGGILRIRDCAKFVRKLIIAWNRDIRNEVIDKNGVVLRVIDESKILDIDWMGFIPSTEPDVFKRIEKTVKKRQFDKVVNDFDAGRFIRYEGINKRRRKTL